MGYDDKQIPIPSGSDGARFLAELGHRTRGPELVKLPANESPQVYALYNPHSGAIDFCEVTAKPLVIQVCTPADLVDVMRDRGSEQSRVFVGETSVVGLFDVASRAERAVLELKKTATGELVSKGWTGTAEALIFLLRTSVSGEKTGLLPLIRTMNLRKGSSITAENQHGAASLSTELQRNAVFGGKAPPEFAEFEFNLFEELPDLAYTQVVRCAFDVNVDSAKLSLTPVATELVAARNATTAELVRVLRNGLNDPKIPVFRGELSE